VKLAQKQGKGNDLPQPNVGRAPPPAAVDVDGEFAAWKHSGQDQDLGSKSKAAGEGARPTQLLLQVEEQDFRVFCGFNDQLLLVADGGAVALGQAFSVQFHRAPGHLQPGVAALT
jgi:hypothetical protein